MGGPDCPYKKGKFAHITNYTCTQREGLMKATAEMGVHVHAKDP